MERRHRQLVVPAMVAAGHSSPTLSRNILPKASRPSKIHPTPSPALNSRPQRGSGQRTAARWDRAACSAQISPAGKRPYSPVRIGLPAMSGRLTDRQQKNPLPIEILPAPQDSPASTDRRAAALQAVRPAEAVDLPGVGEAASPGTPRRAVVSLARVLPVAEVSPRIPPEAAVSLVLPGVEALPERVFRAAVVLAAVSAILAVVLAELEQKQRRPAAAARSAASQAARPGEPALAVHPPKSRRKQKSPNPAQQEPEHLRLLVSLVSVRQVLSLVQQEWALAVPSAPPFLRLGTAGISHRLQPCPRLEYKGPVRHSRNTARSPGRASLR